MALPDIQLPGGFPPFKSEGHTLTPEKLYEQVKRQQGSSRMRRIFSSTPWEVEAGLELSYAQLQEFDDWFQSALLSGENAFAAQVAKIGSGTEWWKGYVVGGYRAEILQGSTHQVSLRLRLVEGPYSSGPAAAAFTAEAVAAMVTFMATGYGNEMVAEASAGLSVTLDLGAVMSAEAFAGLHVTLDGGPTHAALDAEAYCEMQAAFGIEPAAAFTAEASAELLSFFYEDPTMTAEASAALSATFAGTTGYVPTMASLTDTFIGFFSFSVSLSVLTNGQVQVTHIGATTHANWWSPTTPGVGAGNWARLTQSGGTGLNAVANLNTLRSMGSSIDWVFTVPGTGTGTFVGTLDIYSDPDGTNLVSTMALNFTLLSDTPP